MGRRRLATSPGARRRLGNTVVKIDFEVAVTGGPIASALKTGLSAPSFLTNYGQTLASKYQSSSQSAGGDTYAPQANIPATLEVPIKIKDSAGTDVTSAVTSAPPAPSGTAATSGATAKWSAPCRMLAVLGATTVLALGGLF